MRVCLHLSMIVIAIVHVMQFVYGQHVFYLHFLVVSTFGVLCAFLVCPICCALLIAGFMVPTNLLMLLSVNLLIAAIKITQEHIFSTSVAMMSC